jgi:hypothetical protein
MRARGVREGSFKRYGAEIENANSYTGYNFTLSLWRSAISERTAIRKPALTYAHAKKKQGFGACVKQITWAWLVVYTSVTVQGDRIVHLYYYEFSNN